MKTPALFLLLSALLTASEAKRGAQLKPSGFHPLHQALKIGNDPNQDIRANILLNMEGL